MKETYEKPRMITETIEIGTLIAGGSNFTLIGQLQPNLGLCPPCKKK
jgi:hypothetical protein